MRARGRCRDAPAQGIFAFVSNSHSTNRMKHRIWLLAPAAFAVGVACSAQALHPCAAGDGGVPRSGRCAPGQPAADPARLPGYADPAERDGATAPPADAMSGAPADAALQASSTPSAPDAQDAFGSATSVALGFERRDDRF